MVRRSGHLQLPWALTTSLWEVWDAQGSVRCLFWSTHPAGLHLLPPAVWWPTSWPSLQPLNPQRGLWQAEASWATSRLPQRERSFMIDPEDLYMNPCGSDQWCPLGLISAWGPLVDLHRYSCSLQSLVSRYKGLNHRQASLVYVFKP